MKLVFTYNKKNNPIVAVPPRVGMSRFSVGKLAMDISNRPKQGCKSCGG